jgi:hypothetical protein
MDMQEAVENFANAMTHCDNLINVHKAARNGGRGRRTAETSVNRGTIVLAVAAWQVFVQDAAMALRDLNKVSPHCPARSSTLAA